MQRLLAPSGASAIFNSILLAIFFASVLLGFLFAGSGKFWEYLRFCGVECLIVAACLAPWAIRNYRVLGAPVFTRSNAGLELRLSNNDLATADEHVNYSNRLYHAYHPLQNPREAVKVRQMGEIEYNKRANNRR